MDTTVGFGSDRVNNIGLLADRQTAFIISGCIIIVGVILLGFGEVVEKLEKNKQPPPIPNPAKEETEFLKREIELQRRERLDDQYRQQMEEEAKRSAANWKRRRKQMAAVAIVLGSLPSRFDGLLANLVGRENPILYRFIQLLFYVGIPLLVVVVLWVAHS
jgi:hypothetical protein